MGMIINIDKALELRSDYNVLKEPLHAMMKNTQEAWERENPLDMIYARGSIASFQETYTSSIGFDHAFKETSDYAVGPIFNTAEGFAATYRTKTFQGGFIITQQVLEDGQVGKVKDDASAFVKRWNADVVEYGIKSLQGGFGEAVDVNGSRVKLDSADTSDGDIMSYTKNPLFCKEHKTVKREGSEPISQSNMFYVATSDLEIGGDDAGQIAKLADVINQVITNMENLRDDNGKRAGVLGAKTIVAGNDAHLKAALNAALSVDSFCQGETKFPNVAMDRATLQVSPYFNDIKCCYDETNAKGAGFFIVDKGYNAENHGLEMTERIPFTLNAFEHKEAPAGIKYEGRQRFDVNVATWRGIAYVRLGTPGGTDDYWDNDAKYTQITPTTTIVKNVAVVNTVKTKEQQS